MRLLNLFNWTDSYSNAKKMLIRAQTSGNDYTFDANILIEFAEHGDLDVLDNIAKDPKFEIANITYNELYGLSSSGSRFKQNVKKNLRNFLKLIDKSKIISVGSKSSKMIKLRNVSILLPRKVVHDAMFRMNGSWLEKILQLFLELELLLQKTNSSAERVKLNEDRDQIVKVYFSEYYIMENYVTELYSERIVQLEKKYNVSIPADVFSEDEYLKFCKKAVTESKKQALTIVESYFGILFNEKNLKKMRRQLEELASKTYNADLKFVAYVLTNAKEGYSLDSDIIWLYELDHHF